MKHRPNKGCGIETAREYQASLLPGLKKATDSLAEHNERLAKRAERIERGLCPDCGLLVCDHRKKAAE
jgi:hypothetical protein